MILAKNNYKTLVRSVEWQAPIEKQKELLSMRVQVEEIKKKKESCHNRFEWKKKKPTDLNKVKQVNDKENHWCPKHALWILHKPEECKLAEPKEETNRSNTGENKWRLANSG